jgi:hypothetical protein
VKPIPSSSAAFKGEEKMYVASEVSDKQKDDKGRRVRGRYRHERESIIYYDSNVCSVPDARIKSSQGISKSIVLANVVVRLGRGL